jgi:hypothetical protein
MRIGGRQGRRRHTRTSADGSASAGSPKKIERQLLLSDMTVPMAIPSPAGDNPGDDPRVRDRMAATTRRYAGGIAESVAKLADLDLALDATADIRVHCSAPLFELDLINEPSCSRVLTCCRRRGSGGELLAALAPAPAGSRGPLESLVVEHEVTIKV